MGLLTRRCIDRTRYYVHALTLALAPFQFPALYGIVSDAEAGGKDGEKEVPYDMDKDKPLPLRSTEEPTK